MIARALLSQLKSKRKEIADREGKELFRVFTNATLEATAAARPRSRAELMMIKGWGPKKVEKYGDEILALLEGASDGLGALESTLFESEPGAVSASEAIFSVGEFLEAVNITLSRLGIVRVRGEISELEVRDKVVYFKLRDASGETSVRCVLWRWKFDREYGYLEDGLEIIASGGPEVYAKHGSFSLRVERVEAVGEGALQKAFEALKKKLADKGYFDEARKRTVPALVQKIGLITSERGDAIHDFLNNLGAYGFEINFMDVLVEGDRAERAIISAIRWFNKRRPDMDVLVLTRGGGGFESLKTFDSEGVAEAILTSRIPVITGVGHEADKTIAGYVSDRDFSTPTATANFLRGAREEIINMVAGHAQGLTYGMRRILERQRSWLQRAAGDLSQGLARVFERFGMLERRFVALVEDYERARATVLNRLEVTAERASRHVENILASLERRISIAQAALPAFNPEHILSRGYSVVYGASGSAIKDAGYARVGDKIRIRLHRGELGSEIKEIFSS